MAPWSRVLAPVAAAAALGVGLPVGCGSGDRPAPLADEHGNPVPEAGTSLISGDGPTAPSCTVGVEGGVCACADQPLEPRSPNLYFVLDRSGSMSDDNKWGTIQHVLAELIVQLGPRARFGAAAFPNPAQDGCAPGVEVFPTRQGDSPAGTVGATELALISTLGHISANGGTPTAATLESLASHIQSIPGKTYVIFATDGGPNCDASATCGVDQCTDNIENVSGCPTGGSPNCCSNPNYGGPLSCLDTQPAVAAVTALAAAGIPVYIVGVPASEPYADVLDQMAQAGGTARTGEPQYYAITSADQQAFYSTISGIAAKITGTCTLTLGDTPPDPQLVNVFFDGKPIPQSGDNGWTLSGTTVTVLGTSCQEILNGDVLDVRVVAGCPTVLL